MELLQVPAAETAAQALAVRVHDGEGARALQQPGGGEEAQGDWPRRYR